MKHKFYICRRCGNLIEVLKNKGVSLMCCGEKMEALVPNTADAAGEKHLPLVSANEDAVYVNVGSVSHPMLSEHHIDWIYLEGECSSQRKHLNPTEKPEATFFTGDSKPIAVYAYCNLHGLWKTEIK